MFCPSTIVFDRGPLMVIRHERSDYHHGTPLGERLNILRYQFTLWPGTEYRRTFNQNGWLALAWSDLNWRLWKRRWYDFRAASGRDD